jgi:hypothetical protein
MNKDYLIKVRSEIEETYNNLSNPQWVATQLSHLKGKFEVYSEVINSLEGEENATNQSTAGSEAISNDNQGE